MAKVYVGLETGSTTCEIFGMDPDGSMIAQRKFKTGQPQLIQAMKEISGEIHVHLEAGELAGWIRGILKGRVTRIVISNPKMNAWIAKDPQKNDRIDARKLAELLRMGMAEKHQVYYSDDPDRVVFKQIVQQYDRITRHEARIKQQIKARLRVQGVIAKDKAVYTVEGRKPYLKRVRSQAARESIRHMYQLLDGTLKIQKATRGLMQREARRFPEIKRSRQVPGVGPVGACRFSAYVQTPHRFSSKRKLWRYSRLAVTNRMTNDKPLGCQALDWNGIGWLKDMSGKAFCGAMKTRGDNMFKRAYRKSLQRTGDETHARLSTQRKVLSVLRAMWIGGTDYDDQKG